MDLETGRGEIYICRTVRYIGRWIEKESKKVHLELFQGCKFHVFVDMQEKAISNKIEIGINL